VKYIFRKILQKIHQKSLPPHQYIKDDQFLRWVQFAVPGMTGGHNIDNMRYAITNLPSNSPIVEIGSFCGLSTIIISHFKHKLRKTNTIYTCDKWEFEGQILGTTLGDVESITHDTYKDFVRGTYIRNIKTFCNTDLPVTIEEFSDEFFNMWANNQTVIDVLGRNVKLGGPISFAFIDGNHTYSFAKRDFENVDRFLEKGGFVLFDDSSDYSHWEVNRVAKEVLKSGGYELIARNPNYLFRKK